MCPSRGHQQEQRAGRESESADEAPSDGLSGLSAGEVEPKPEQRAGASRGLGDFRVLGSWRWTRSVGHLRVTPVSVTPGAGWIVGGGERLGLHTFAAFCFS